MIEHGNEGMIETGEPRTAAEIAAALRAVHRQSAELYCALSDQEFVKPQGEAWSPAEHARHLRRSVRPVERAMGMPKLALLLRFGPAWKPSRDFAGVRAIYQDLLGRGARAMGPFVPPPRGESEPLAEWRSRVEERLGEAVEDLAARVETWSDLALDRLRLPHPLLGKLTLREMLFFTVYHNAHHARRVAERRGT